MHLLLLFAFRDLWKECGDSNFQIFFFTELPVPPHAPGFVTLNNCVFKYNSDILGTKNAILFFQCLLFLFICIKVRFICMLCA